MEIALAWVVFSYLCGKYGEKKGLSFTKFFWISLLISPVIGFIWCAISQENMDVVEYKKIVTKQNKRCPHCDELVRILANKCKHCGGDLSGSKSDGGKEVCSKCNEPRIGKFIKKCLNCGKMFND